MSIRYSRADMFSDASRATHRTSCVTLTLANISDHPQDELMLLRSELAQKERELAAARKLIQEAGDSQVVKNTLERVKELVDCTVCFETLSNPFTVDPCGHEFCAGCLHDWFKDRRSKNEALECPMCRTRVERPPIRAIILRGVSDMLCDMDPPHSTHTVANDKEFWSELFPPTKPILSYHLQGLPQHQPLALTIPVPGLYIPSGWRLPPKIPPHRLPLDLSHFPNELIRRGASLRMIFHFGLQYSPEEGITCFLGRFHVHFGWFIFEWMTAWAERSDGLQASHCLYYWKV
ncbi:hypothetical protein DL93DRAFT_96586 [Clavulina sp. PMI_390]|nr:hypothetical protein DL93DRAFT_96586 [Clavulina sp. PMI_390]